MTLHKGVTHCSADVQDCIGASNELPVLRLQIPLETAQFEGLHQV